MVMVMIMLYVWYSGVFWSWQMWSGLSQTQYKQVLVTLMLGMMMMMMMMKTTVNMMMTSMVMTNRQHGDLTSLIVCVGSTSTSLGAVSMLSEISVLIAIRIWPLRESMYLLSCINFMLWASACFQLSLCCPWSLDINTYLAPVINMNNFFIDILMI